MEKNNKILLIIVTSLSIVTLSICGVYAVRAWQTYQESLTKTVTSSHSQYTLRNNATAYQKEVYEALVAIDAGSDAEVSELIVKNFVADFYTWTNKVKMNDVGGIKYLHPDVRVWVYDQALDRFYNDMRVYIEKDQIQDTLEVMDVQTEAKATKFMLNDEEVPAFQVQTSWTYQPSSMLDTNHYQDKAVITVVKHDDMYSIVEVSNGTQQTSEKEPA